jgi:CheY-like chemotaxis protein
MASFDKSKKESQKVDEHEAGTPDLNNEVQAEASDENKDRNIVVATYESQFSDKMVSYTLEMAVRMNCDIIAVNCANLTHDITEFFSNAHDVAFEEFKKNSDRNAEDFRAKAIAQGLQFANMVHFSDIDNAIDAAIKEYGKPEFIITENPASIAKGGSISGNVLAKRSKGNINILLVDDNPKFLNALADRIKLQGYEPLTALNGKEALDIIQTKTVHLAIIDQRLPDMDGLALIGKLKEINASVHSSLLTGHGDEKLKEATEALKSFYFEKEDMGSFWGFFRKILNSLGSEDGNEQVIAQTFCVYSIE